MFFRLKRSHNDSAILILYDPNRVENTYYVDIATFLRDIDVPVPRFIRHDSTRCLVVMEDLGDTDLWSLRENPWEIRRSLYQKTLTAAYRLHAFPEGDFPSSRVRLMEGFGPDLYRWERDYFNHHFVRDACGIKLEPSFERELEAELSKLAERLMATKRSLVHRHAAIPERDGPKWGSLLHRLPGNALWEFLLRSWFASLRSLCDFLRQRAPPELLSFYYELSKLEIDLTVFHDTFWEASAQRLMQALGAYGFLGLKKGLKTYLNHIPGGLRSLHFAATQVLSLRSRLPRAHRRVSESNRPERIECLMLNRLNIPMFYYACPK